MIAAARPVRTTCLGKLLYPYVDRHSIWQSTSSSCCREAEAERIPFLGDMEPLSALQAGSCAWQTAPKHVTCAIAAMYTHALAVATFDCTSRLPALTQDCLIVQTRYNLKHLAEYEGGSEVFRTKIAGLERTYSGMRRTRGDGNCFFRSFIFAYIEDILQRKDFNERHRSFTDDCVFDINEGLWVVSFAYSEDILQHKDFHERHRSAQLIEDCRSGPQIRRREVEGSCCTQCAREARAGRGGGGGGGPAGARPRARGGRKQAPPPPPPPPPPPRSLGRNCLTRETSKWPQTPSTI